MECLINGIKNETISYQTFIKKNTNKNRSALLKKIDALKSEGVNFDNRLLELESLLNKQLDLELRAEIENLSSYEYLNDEKITPYFVSLAKNNKATASTDTICDDNGNAFINAADRNEYVREFYAKLYRVPDGQPANVEGCIENFLGPEILNSRLIADSKIPADKAQELESDITIEELDVSVLQGNKSAAGMDGLNNCFIKRYWKYLRTPLHRYLTCCVRTSRLTDSFRSAKIKIIPKKGDPKKIGNWRPISLLSCLYKVASRAFNNRLKKVRDIIFSRAQKGFTNERHIQEVLINVVESIAHCKQNNIPACILSIDQAKAFDSVSHSYKNEVFRFFGFGPRFINLMNTLCTNRTACISFDDGSLSANFDLDRGDAQGNTPSPILYNISQQIFLFKLELCPEIKTVFTNHLIPRMIGHVPDEDEDEMEDDVCFRNESNKETDKAEGFADDTTGLSLFELESLSTLKRILIEFGSFSGLQCNVDKTVLMQVGYRPAPPQEILDLGFTFVDEIKILGMTIDHSLDNLDENFLGILESIKKSANYWKRFRLSLPGRINVAKSLLVSLVNYLGCFLMPKPNTLNSIQKTIDDFIIANDKVARNRLYLPPECGGLGCFKLDEFLFSQQCVWPLRAAIYTRDNWRVNLKELSHGNCLSLSWRNIDQNRNPILFGFGKAMEKLRTCYDSLNENYLHATVLYNPLIFRGPGDKQVITPEFLEAGGHRSMCKKLAFLTIDDCYGQNGLISRVEFRIVHGIDLSLQGYANLGRAVNHFVDRISVNALNDGTSVPLFMSLQLKKPGTKIRSLLVKRRKKPFNLENTPTCKSFFNITGIPYPGNEKFTANAWLWNNSGFTNRQKMFLFKFYNNTLGINTPTSHFAQDGTRNCFFCSKKRIPEQNDETFTHLFINCSTVQDWHDSFINKCFPELLPLNDMSKKSLWFLGFYDELYTPIVIHAFLSFQYCVWEAKLKKTIPSFNTLFLSFSESFSLTFKHNASVRKSSLKNNFSLCRVLLGDRQAAHDGGE
jgi:hypothetical protein